MRNAGFQLFQDGPGRHEPNIHQLCPHCTDCKIHFIRIWNPALTAKWAMSGHHPTERRMSWEILTATEFEKIIHGRGATGWQWCSGLISFHLMAPGVKVAFVKKKASQPHGWAKPSVSSTKRREWSTMGRKQGLYGPPVDTCLPLTLLPLHRAPWEPALWPLQLPGSGLLAALSPPGLATSHPHIPGTCSKCLPTLSNKPSVTAERSPFVNARVFPSHWSLLQLLTYSLPVPPTSVYTVKNLEHGKHLVRNFYVNRIHAHRKKQNPTSFSDLTFLKSARFKCSRRDDWNMSIACTRAHQTLIPLKNARAEMQPVEAPEQLCQEK